MDNQDSLKAFVEKRAATPWREVMIERLTSLGLDPWKSLELRVASSAENRDVFDLAQRGVNAFFTAFMLYPTSLAVHSTVAQLFEAAEKSFVAKLSWVKRNTPEMTAIAAEAMRELGEGFQAVPIHIEVDDSLDINTVAVRFSINYEENEEAFKGVLMRIIRGLRG